MRLNNFLGFLLIFFLGVSIRLSASTHEAHEEPLAVETASEDGGVAERKAYIKHHLLDSYDFHLFSNEKEGKHYGFPLPIILWDKGLHVFMSSAFHHGESIVESKGNYYKVFHNKIYKTDAEGTITLDEHHHAVNEKPLDFSITKNVFTVMAISLILVFIFVRIGSSYKKNQLPKGAAKFLEPLVLYVRDEIAIPNIGEHDYKKYMPYLLTVFFFVWLVNLFGLTPLGVNVTNNISVTFALAFMTFLITQLTAKGEYWKHIFWMPGVPVPMKIILAPIELLGVFIKPFALMIRLFANITAGHVVLMSLIALIWKFDAIFAQGSFIVLTFCMSLLELLVAFLQAYIFTMLSALYFGSASAEHHDDH